MATYYVTKVRKESVKNTKGESHKHIVGVKRDNDAYSTNQQVIDSIKEGNRWYTKVSGEPNAEIKDLAYCPNASCYHKPYLTTAPDHTTKNNLENLPEG